MISQGDFKIIDISPEISPEIAVYPGDTKFSRNLALDMNNGEHLTLSDMTTTLHVGAHTDAPNHYAARGEGIGSRDLNFYLGLCQVIEVNLKPRASIDVKDIEGVAITAPRVLFKTSSFQNPNEWYADFNSLSAELVEYLASKKVVLVGIDTPSIDPDDSKELSAHKAVFKNNLAILEGVVLDRVEPGLYYLIALPLKIKDADASPVRAVLLS
ncbi:MAG: cyclase family protein [Bdellovibrionales bacterium]|nr:cyclase family protein [Bdellovibrionales bacterium]